MTDEDLQGVLAKAVTPHVSMLPPSMLRELIRRSDSEDFLRDPDAAVVAPKGDAQVGLFAAAKFIALCLAFLRYVTKYLKNQRAAEIANQLYPEFINNQLPPHIVSALPDDVRAKLFSMYLEVRRATSKP